MQRANSDHDRVPNRARTSIIQLGALVVLLAFGMIVVAHGHHRSPDRDDRDDRRIPNVVDEEDAEVLTPLTSNPVPVAFSIQDVEVDDGFVEFSIHVDTTGASSVFDELSFGVAFLEPEAVAVDSVEIGPALAAYVAENGAPPTCDIVIYPSRQAAVGSITKLLPEAPFSSEAYGTEFLRLRYEITDTRLRRATAQVFTEEDMDWRRDATSFVVLPNENDSATVALRQSSRPRLVHGDVNADSTLELTDAISMVRLLFFGDQVTCRMAADVNRDTEINVSDPIFLLGALFMGEATIESLCESPRFNVPRECESEACDL
jgi:hypothetical protein